MVAIRFKYFFGNLVDKDKTKIRQRDWKSNLHIENWQKWTVFIP